MKIIAIIPSRYGSTRFEGKPLVSIAGKPMIQHVYENASGAIKIDQVVVATDDERILSVVQQFGGVGVMTSAANRSGTDRVAEAAETLGLAMDDIIINVQGDQPLINPICLDAVVEPLINGITADISTLAYQISDQQEYTNPKDCKVVVDNKGYAMYFSRAPIPFVRDEGERYNAYKHLGIYAYQRRFLEIFRNLPLGACESAEKLEQLRALEFGYKIRVVQTTLNSPEVDLPEDVAKIEKLLRSKR